MPPERPDSVTNPGPNPAPDLGPAPGDPANGSPQAWKTADGRFLVKGEDVPLPLGVSVQLPDGRSVSAAARHFLVGADGAVLRTYGAPAGYSLDETLGIADIHAVAGPELWSLHWVDHAMREPEVRRRLELSGLEPVSGAGLPFDPRRFR